MRLFLAVTPPEPAVRHLSEALAARTGMPAGPRWTPAERWHITLAFLGDVDESTVDSLVDMLDAVTGEPLHLAVAGAGTFPDQGAPRVLWAGLSGDVPALQALAKRVRIAVRAARITLDRKPFRPHLTLGRWRAGDPADPAVGDLLADYRGPEFEVTGFSLIRSHLGPQPRYETLQEWPLQRPQLS